VRLYLLFKLPDADSRAAQDKIYALEARQEKAAKTKADEAAAQTVATPPQNSFDALLRKIDGRRYTHEVGVTNLGNRATKVYDVKDNTLVYGIILGGTYSSIQSYPHVRIQGLMSIEQIPPPPEELQGVVGKWPVERTLTISNDGDKITEHVRDNYGSVSEEIYFWQR